MTLPTEEAEGEFLRLCKRTRAYFVKNGETFRRAGRKALHHSAILTCILLAAGKRPSAIDVVATLCASVIEEFFERRQEAGR